MIYDMIIHMMYAMIVADVRYVLCMFCVLVAGATVAVGPESRVLRSRRRSEPAISDQRGQGR